MSESMMLAIILSCLRNRVSANDPVYTKVLELYAASIGLRPYA